MKKITIVLSILFIAFLGINATAQTFPPVLNTIGIQGSTENINLNFVVSATDADITTPTLTTSTLPSGASFLDNGDGTGAFNWTPTFLQSGIYNVTFYANDVVTADIDSEIVVITINEAGNQTPILTSIGAQSTTENIQLTFGITSSDIESTPVLTTTALPGTASFIDNGDGTGSFDWIPTFLESGSYDITFTATDDSIVFVSEIVTITVNEAGNQTPILTSIGAQSTTENVQLTFGITSSDIESTPVLTTSALPGTASFIDNGDGSGSFDWTPTFLESGTFNVTFFATDDSLSVVSEIVTITVNEAGNQTPILTSIGAQATTENIQLTFGITSSDIESTPVLTTSALPGTASFIDNGDGSGSFDWTPTFLESGTYDITFTATDDSTVFVSEIVTITVNEAGNQTPILTSIGAQATTENVQLTFGISSSDIESTPVLTTSALPGTASFIDNGDGTGSFDWTPTFLESGTYDITFTATDDSTVFVSEIVTITVNEAGNQTPILTSIGAQSTTENVQLTFGITSSDIESIPTLSATSLPVGASFIDNGDGTGSFDWTPTFLESGSYDITFTATDDSTSFVSEIVTVTVNEAGNQTPILTSIGAQATTENVQLTFGISSSDIESIPTLSATSLPVGASFLDNGDGSGSFDWTPTFLESGSYDITFFATDDSSEVDLEIVTITVNDAGNQLPVFSALGIQSTIENINLSFVVSANDDESAIVSLTNGTLPIGASFNDNGDGTGTFNWTPNFIQSGIYNVTFYATDDSLGVDSQIVTVDAIDAGNQNPILGLISSQSTTEGVSLSFSVSAVDPDSTIPALSVVTLPNAASFIDNGDGTGQFNWTPLFNQSGNYNLTFYATDDTLGIDSQTISFTIIESGNHPPVLSSIGNQASDEGNNLNFLVSAIDPDSTIPILTTSALPTGAAFVNNGNGTYTFDWTPGYTQAGSYDITFFASDGGASDSEKIFINVFEVGNQSPTLALVGNQITTEGLLLNFVINATDPDSTISVLTTSTLPGSASFIDNGDGSGSFDWTPEYDENGIYNLTLYASDGVATDSETIAITVNEAGNQPPVLASIGAQGIPEGTNLSFVISSSDADGTIPALTSSALPTGASFIDNSDGTGSFDWTPDFTQDGIYNITFYANDGIVTDSEVVTITVADQGNQIPVLAGIGAQSTTEGILLSFGMSATDADATTPSFTSSTLPSGASFIDNGDGTGSFSWTPDFVQNGSYDITFYASDGVAIDSEIVTVTVTEAGNQEPILSTVGPQTTTEGLNLNLLIAASDPDGSIPVMSTSVLPSGASYLDNGDGTGIFDWTPDFTQSGSYFVIFYATDAGLAADSEIVSITINEAGNQTPILATIGSQNITEGNILNIAITASDPDGTIPFLSTSTLPGGASFIDNGDGSGDFDWLPGFTESGSYNITFYVNDGAVTDSEVVTITVVEAGNQTPVLSSIGSRSTTEGLQLLFDISAIDPDATIPVFSALTLPVGALFIDNGDGTATFDWTPSFVQTGTYGVTFITSDGIANDSELVTITVSEAGNQTPGLTSIGSQSITENSILSFGITASDPEGATPILTTSFLPVGASFVDNGDGSGSFDWTPDFTQSGSYSVTFYVSDGLAQDSEVVAITVIEAGNQLPVLASIGSQVTTENIQLLFSLSSSDVDGTVPTFSTSSLPSGAVFTDNFDGTGDFDWTPSFVQSGSYNVTFYAFDGIDLDSEIVIITVIESGNQTPVLASIGTQAVTEGTNIIFGISASDLDETIPSLSTSLLPTGASFTDNLDGSGSFDWSPDFTQSGTYNITFYANDGLSSDSEIVTVSVSEAGNQQPLLASIGPKSSNENVLLTFSVTSTDADGTIPTMTTSTLPSGSSYIDNGDGSGTFNWTPNFTQSGSYQLTFYASDGLATDSETVSITINEEGNQSPTLNIIGAQVTTEGINLNFNMTATDPDLTNPTFSSSALPSGATLIDNLDGSATFDWSPIFTQSGSYDMTFFASDGLAIDSEIVTITVNEAGNQSPELSSIGAQSVVENVNLNFNINSSDPDGTIPTLSTSALPTGASFVDNADSSGTFDWSPDFTQSGTYNVTFYVADGIVNDSEVVTITVNEAGNQTPVLTLIGSKNIIEGNSLTFGISAIDLDGIIPSLITSALPSGSSFIDNGDGTGTFNWTPTFTQSGTYNVTFIATDGIVSDSEVVAITVNEAGNQSPALAVIGSQSVTEGTLLNFGVSSSDPDGINPSLSVSTLPTGASFVDNGDGTGDFNWTPDFVQANLYNITFYASDGASVDSEQVSITVNEAGNQTPVLATIGSQNGTEGNLLNLAISSSDVDGTIPAVTSSTLPSGASFVDNGDGTGDFVWTPDFTQSGTYNITFYANDGIIGDSEIVVFSISEAGNQSPILSLIGNQTTTEGVILNLLVSAVDPDATIPSLSAISLPIGATYVDNGDGTGSFSWTPDYTQAGIYNITFNTTDGILNDNEIVTVTVIEAGNQNPVLATIGAQSVSEGLNIAFTVSAIDPDSTTPILTASILPVGATFVDNGDGTGSFDWTPDFTQSGSYDITFSASDGVLLDAELVTFTVSESGNQSPVLTAIGDQNITEGNTLLFASTSIDPDGTIPLLSSSTIPTGASYIDNGDGTGSFSWTPDFTQTGSYPVTFYASDGILIDSELITITVFEAGNQIPVLNFIGAKNISEGVLLSFAVSASDADGTIPAINTSTLPSGASFVDNGDGTGSLDWTPTYIQSGAYNLTFYAWDGIALDSEIVSISVTEAGNQQPQLVTIGAQSSTEGVLLSFGISATDPDATTPALSAVNLPAGAVFVDNGNGSGSFNWSPTFVQAGSYDVTFIASDGVLTNNEIVTITITDAGNQNPVLSAIGPQSGAEGVLLNFAISSSDPDATIPTVTSSTLPTGALFVDNGDGTGSFEWTPTFVQAGGYNISFYASDGTAIDSESVIITIIEAGNQNPVLAVIGPQTTTEGSNLNFGISATDPDASIPGLSTSTLPSGASFVDNGDGSGTFDWTTTFVQSGLYNITFYATDGLAIDSEIVTVIVSEAGNQTPIITTIGSQSGTEGLLLSFGISATDPDGSTPVLNVSTLPGTASFIDNGDGTGTFNWTPDFIEAGIHNVTFYAFDGLLTDSEIVTITINEAGNQDPVLAAIGPQSGTENILLSFVITASDVDATIPSFAASTLPSGASFVDNGDGSGTFNWTAGFTQAGIYNIKFYANDGFASDSELVTITINESGNQSPVLTAIGSQSIVENSLLSFGISASDPDATTPILSTSTLPYGASYVDNSNGTGNFNWTPDFAQQGIYDITFFAFDGVLIDSEIVQITVTDGGNQSPILAVIGAQSVTESNLLNFTVSATDADSTITGLSTTVLPFGATFVDNGDGTGSFNWIPDFSKQGVYNITFTATDGSLSDVEIVSITVLDAGNQSPILFTIGNQSVSENVNLNFDIDAADPDSTIPALTTSALPAGAIFTDNGDGTGNFDWTPSFSQEGIYSVTFTASDGALIASEVIQINVTTTNQTPIADAGLDQFDNPAGQSIQLDGTSSFDPDGGSVNYNWLQISGSSVTLSDNTASQPTFTPTVIDVYVFELVVDDGINVSAPDTVEINVISGASPESISDLSIQIINDEIQLSWSPISIDTDGLPATIDRYVIYRGTSAYFTPISADSIGSTDNLTMSFTDADLNGANVVGDTSVQYFYTVQVVNFLENRSAFSNRVGEYDYGLEVTSTTNYNLVGVPFTNTGIANADDLISSIGNSNVLTVNNYVVASQSFQSRFAAGFGTNFSVVPGGIYQVNAAVDTIFSVAGSVPDPGTVYCSIEVTATTDFNFIMIPFEMESSFSVAQDVIDSTPGLFNTLNNFMSISQSYVSRFAIGFGTNFVVKAGKPYQANAAAAGLFPAP